jgi:hypothetical protein
VQNKKASAARTAQRVIKKYPNRRLYAGHDGGEPRAIQKHVFANAGANAKANAKADWSDAWGLWNQALIKVNVGKIDT